MSYLFYQDAAWIASCAVDDDASVMVSFSADPMVEALDHAIDEGDLDFTYAPSAHDSFGTPWPPLYNQLCDVGNELSLHAPCDVVGLLCLAEDGLPHVLLKTWRPIYITETTGGMYDLSVSRHVESVWLSSLVYLVCSVSSRWLSMRRLFSASPLLPIKLPWLLLFVAVLPS